MSKIVRIVGVNLPNKHIEVALRSSVYGIGPTRARKIRLALGLDEQVKPCDLDDDMVTRLQQEVQKFEVEGDLRRNVSRAIDELKKKGCYRGKRHRAGLPCRGQKTKTNARTRKGKKKGQSGKKAA